MNLNQVLSHSSSLLTGCTSEPVATLECKRVVQHGYILWSKFTENYQLGDVIQGWYTQHAMGRLHRPEQHLTTIVPGVMLALEEQVMLFKCPKLRMLHMIETIISV